MTLSQRTFGNEEHLPRVPVPTLADTGRRFLEWCAPLLTDAQLAETEAAVASFLAPDSPAHEQQAALERYDAREDVPSWLEDFWAYRYLGRRDRIALNANYFFLFHDSGQDQVERAAALVAGAVDYKLALDEEAVPPVVLRGRPLSMAQQRFLFGTTRIPGAVQDTVHAPFPATARHIVVFCRATPFRLDVLDDAGRPYDRADLAEALRSIAKAGPFLDDPATSPGHLTTMARADWADARQAMLDAGNVAALADVESALFCLCLEDVAPAGTKEACDQLLYGNSGNRWYDKSFSLVVFADGTAGINVEHCGLDGTTILAFVDTLLTSAPSDRPAAQGQPAVAPVEFTLDGPLRAVVRAAGESFADYGAATATETLSFPEFGADTAKRLGMSPDAFVQLAYQLAHRRAKGLTGATYESIATRQFRHGRTEAMRVVTPEVLAFVSTMDDPAADRETRRAAFVAAAERHVARAKECQAGAAPEQHLWELDLIGRRAGATESHPLYRSPGWLVMRDDYLSTSSAPSANVQFFGFGSTSPQCIGVAYVLLPDHLNIYLSTPAHVADQMDAFARELTSALGELRDLLAGD
ncbi:choline/carnitine O-acyltransferase [Actinophytocola gossypii]|uniref:Choline/carnitine O-acyltransferase n=1 Tax=Actinophytocola gossypii TaxID=2812003 RepID=A0ABT2J0V3_9PSEU|nr:choline/carnitine O-acyltransferase [Actinophytocola gossypii]MCT2581503.1 choline/carnitine O-acyltransferase [Actinophytocola gossypii]